MTAHGMQAGLATAIVQSSWLLLYSVPCKSHLHSIIYAHACCDRPSRRVDEQLDVLHRVSLILRIIQSTVLAESKTQMTVAD